MLTAFYKILKCFYIIFNLFMKAILKMLVIWVSESFLFSVLYLKKKSKKHCCGK